MSFTVKVAPALTLGGRFWRLQNQAGQVAINSSKTFHSREFSSAGAKMHKNAFPYQKKSGSDLCQQGQKLGIAKKWF